MLNGCQRPQRHQRPLPVSIQAPLHTRYRHPTDGWQAWLASQSSHKTLTHPYPPLQSTTALFLNTFAFACNPLAVQIVSPQLVFSFCLVLIPLSTTPSSSHPPCLLQPAMLLCCCCCSWLLHCVAPLMAQTHVLTVPSRCARCFLAPCWLSKECLLTTVDCFPPPPPRRLSVSLCSPRHPVHNLYRKHRQRPALHVQGLRRHLLPLR